jgi:hypothetical protein
VLEFDWFSIQVKSREGGDSSASSANAGSSGCTCTYDFAIKNRVASRVRFYIA